MQHVRERGLGGGSEGLGAEVKAWRGLHIRRSRFLKVDNRYENLGCGSNPKTLLLNSFFKICSCLLRK
jgi:hypothetical protein